MALIIPPGFGLAAYIFSGSLGTPVHVTTMGHDISGFGGDHVAAANAAMGTYGISMMSLTTQNLTLERVNLAVGQDGPGGSVDSDLEPIEGTRTGTQEAISMSPIFRKVTNVLGRSGRGRSFGVGLLNNNHVDPDGRIVAQRLGQLQTAADEWHDAMANGVGSLPAVPPVLLHSFAGPTIPSPITGLVVSPIVGWIRGRIR